MCLGIPGRIIELSDKHPDLARVDVHGVTRDINMALLSDAPPGVGDWILIHLGFALERMDADQAREAESALVDLA